MNINLTSISKSYLCEEIIVQNFDDLSSLLQNPQILNVLQQMNNNQNDSTNGDCDNKVAFNNANSQQNIPNMQNLQMISNMMSMLNGNSMQNPFSTPNNMNIQNIMMLMNLISQMQNNNINNSNTQKEDEK